MTYWLETKYECLKLLRMPGKLLPQIFFPVVFYSFFGLSSRTPKGAGNMALYLLGTYGVFGVMGAALMGVGAGVAIERGLGWMQLKRASPMPAVSDLLAKFVVAVLLGLTSVALLFGLGFVFGGVRIPVATAFSFAATMALGAVPFCALGLAIAYFATAQSANAVINLIYLPMAFCSGLWIPMPLLPTWMQNAASASPAYHLAQTALLILNQPASGTIGGHVGALLAFTMFFSGIAWLGYSLDESRA